MNVSGKSTAKLTMRMRDLARGVRLGDARKRRAGAAAGRVPHGRMGIPGGWQATAGSILTIETF
jgi:hypothetical protein